MEPRKSYNESIHQSFSVMPTFYQRFRILLAILQWTSNCSQWMKVSMVMTQLKVYWLMMVPRCLLCEFFRWKMLSPISIDNISISYLQLYENCWRLFMRCSDCLFVWINRIIKVHLHFACSINSLILRWKLPTAFCVTKFQFVVLVFGYLVRISTSI